LPGGKPLLLLTVDNHTLTCQARQESPRSVL
jgi:hypothetical protein